LKLYIKRDPRKALTKNELITKISEEMELTRKDATESVEQLMEIIKSTLASGEDVMVSGFGKFCVVKKNQRKGRNPATGDDLMLDARTRVTFKCSGKLRDRVNRGKEGGQRIDKAEEKTGTRHRKALHPTAICRQTAPAGRLH
jgi:integration host factor subunit alpha